MKNIIYSVLLVCTIVNFGFGQKTLEKGHVRLEITEVGADDEQMASMLQMMKGSFSDFYFNGKQSLATMNMMGGMMQTKTLTNNTDGSMIMLFEAMGNKMYVESTEEEKKKLNEGSMPDVKVEYDENDTKTILGYKTKKANIVFSGKSNMSISAYVAPDIKLSNKIVQGLESINLDGFPLRYDIKVNGISMVMTATKVDTDVDAAVFNVTTEGYTKTTLVELTKNLGGMAGGMGF